MIRLPHWLRSGPQSFLITVAGAAEYATVSSPPTGDSSCSSTATGRHRPGVCFSGSTPAAVAGRSTPRTPSTPPCSRPTRTLDPECHCSPTGGRVS
jgi:hypothetical protein